MLAVSLARDTHTPASTVDYLVTGLTGARVALGYAPPVVLIASLVAFERPVRIGSFVTAGVRLSIAPWQALAFPLVIAAAASAAGGLWSWADASDRVAAVRMRAALGGGWWMLLVGLGLSYAGLLVAGVVQPDEPVALATPSTAHYYATVFERPGLGAVILGHHLLLVPNEALWTLVPASGACDVVRGGERADLLCYGSFPSVSEGGGISFGSAPAGYLLFLLVPAIATVFGGRYAGLRSDPFFLDFMAYMETFSSGRLALKAEGNNFSYGQNVLGLVVETDCAPLVQAGGGSLFAVGTHPIQVSATDATGKVSTCTFDITVLSPDGQPGEENPDEESPGGPGEDGPGDVEAGGCGGCSSSGSPAVVLALLLWTLGTLRRPRQRR